MRLVLDASVAVASLQRTAPSHAAAARRIRRALRGEDEIVVPWLFAVEVSAALARLGIEAERARMVVDLLTSAPHEAHSLGRRAARTAADVARTGRLRGADAVYLALAVEERLPLCTLDAEMAKRGARLCRILSP